MSVEPVLSSAEHLLIEIGKHKTCFFRALAKKDWELTHVEEDAMCQLFIAAVAEGKLTMEEAVPIAQDLSKIGASPAQHWYA